MVIAVIIFIVNYYFDMFSLNYVMKFLKPIDNEESDFYGILKFLTKNILKIIVHILN